MSEATLPFGTVSVGTLATRTLTLTNAGLGTAGVLSVGGTGGGALAVRSDCVAATLALADSCDVTVT